MTTLDKLQEALQYMQEARRLVNEAKNENRSLDKYYGYSLLIISRDLTGFTDNRTAYLGRNINLHEIIHTEGEKWHSKEIRLERKRRNTGCDPPKQCHQRAKNVINFSTSFSFMKAINLKHLQPLACEAYAGLAIFPEQKADSVIKEFTDELSSDVQNIRNTAASGIAEKNLESGISKYCQRYEFHLTAWLQSSVENKFAFICPMSASTVTTVLDRRKLVRNKYNYFREWRRRTVNMISKSIKQTQMQKKSNERKRTPRVVNSDKEAKYIKRR